MIFYCTWNNTMKENMNFIIKKISWAMDIICAVIVIFLNACNFKSNWRVVATTRATTQLFNRYCKWPINNTNTRHCVGKCFSRNFEALHYKMFFVKQLKTQDQCTRFGFMLIVFTRIQVDDYWLSHI